VLNTDRYTEGQTSSGSRQSLNFIENPWGSKARQSVEVTKKLPQSRWATVIACASRFLSVSLEIPELDEGTVGDDLYSQIEIE